MTAKSKLCPWILLTALAATVSFIGCGGATEKPGGDNAAENGPAESAGTNATSFTGIWSGFVDLEAPGFAGPPIDTMILSFDATGLIRYAGFEKFPRTQTYGEPAHDFPRSTSRAVTPKTGGLTWEVTIEESVWEGTSFRLRYRAVAKAAGCDFVESIAGSAKGEKLSVEYTIKGALFSASIDAHGAGLLSQ